MLVVTKDKTKVPAARISWPKGISLPLLLLLEVSATLQYVSFALSSLTESVSASELVSATVEQGWKIVLGDHGMRQIDRLSKVGTKRRDLVSHVNAYRRVSTTKRDSEWKNKMTQLMWASLCLWPPTAHGLVYEWSGHSGREVPLATECSRWASQRGFPQIWFGSCWMFNLPAKETHTVPLT